MARHPITGDKLGPLVSVEGGDCFGNSLIEASLKKTAWAFNAPSRMPRSRIICGSWRITWSEHGWPGHVVKRVIVRFPVGEQI
jgi:hypothetical protein